VQTLSKQIGQVMASHARSVEVGQPTAGVGFEPKLAVAPVTRTVSVNPYLPLVESMLFGM
jgi:hypothetical protein